MPFGDCLKKYRKHCNLSLRQLSKRVGLSCSYLSEIESNQKPPPNDRVLIILSKKLGLNDEERVCFFDAAMYSKNTFDKANFHIPADIGEYLINHKEAKRIVRKSLKINNKKGK